MVLLVRPNGASNEKLQLLDEVERALRPYLTSMRKPPFSMEQLFIISLLFNPNADMKKALKWVISNIPYYRNQAFDHFAGGTSYNSVANEFRGLLHRFDVPITSEEWLAIGTPAQIRFNTTCTEARHLLGEFLPPSSGSRPTEKAFPFMRLPAELRVRVYELVLGFPKSGVFITRHHYERRGPPRVRAATRDYSVAKSPWNWMTSDSGDRLPTLECSRLQDHLTLLRASKQIYAEAMPVFYSINTFLCLDDFRFLENTPDERKKHIRDVTIAVRLPSWMRPTVAQMTKGFKMLKAMKDIRTLDIIVFENEWQEATKRDGTSKYGADFDLLDLEPIKVLRSMRGLQKVEFHGDCESISKILVPEMTAPVLEPIKKRRASRKRAAGDGADGQDGAGVGKAKRGRKAKAS